MSRYFLKHVTAFTSLTININIKIQTTPRTLCKSIYRYLIYQRQFIAYKTWVLVIDYFFKLFFSFKLYRIEKNINIIITIK